MSTHLTLFISESLEFFDTFKPNLVRIRQGRALEIDIETFLRLVHATAGSSSKLELKPLTEYCQQVEEFLIKIKKSSKETSMAQISTTIEAHDLIFGYLNRLKFDPLATLEIENSLSKIRLQISK